ncbi:MAG: hypothetical protein R2827_16205 [Bdellovibrionales bacterium]
MRTIIYLTSLCVILNTPGTAIGSGGTTENTEIASSPAVSLGWPSGVSSSEHWEMLPLETSPPENQESSASDLYSVLKKEIARVPEGNLRNGIERYLDVLSFEDYSGDSSVGHSNEGISAYMSTKFSQNQCFQDLAISFYEEIQKWDPDENEASSPYDVPDDPLYGRPSISQSAGKAPNERLQPGWLWKTAMKHSKGDPNLAMALVAMCGHDDYSQGEFAWEDDSAAAREEIAERIKWATERVEKNRKRVMETPATDPQFKAYASVLQLNTQTLTDLKSQTSVPRTFMCNQETSRMYVPESLGKGVTISDDLKNKIATLQAPTLGAKAIPAKHYHVYGAAFMACQLIQEGVKPDTAIFLQKSAARAYRGIRMCSQMQDLLEERKLVFEDYQKYRKEFVRKKVGERNTVRGSRPIMSSPLGMRQYLPKRVLEIKRSDLCEPPAMTSEQQMQDWQKNFGERCNAINNLVGVPYSDPDLTEEIIAEKIKAKMAKLDAAVLYDKWYLGGGTIAGKNIPCTDIRIRGPKSIVPNGNNTTRRRQRNVCGSSFSNAECDEARKILATWDVDFEWTTAQHEVGARFAAENCKKLKPGEDPIQNACNAMDTNNQSVRPSRSDR